MEKKNMHIVWGVTLSHLVSMSILFRVVEFTIPHRSEIGYGQLYILI